MKLPKNIRNASIRVKMLLISIWVGVVTVLLSFGIFLVYDFITLRSERVDEQVQLARLIGKSNRVTVDFRVPTSAKADLYKLLSSDPRITYACIFGSTNQVFVDYDRRLFEDTLKSDLQRLSNYVLDKPNALQSNVNPEYKETSVNFDWWENTVEVYEVTRDENEDRKNNTVYIRSTLDDMYSRYVRYLLAIAVIFIVTVALATALSFKLLQIISEPILKLAGKANEISQSKDYSIRVDVGAREDEIGQLAQAFNEMLERIMRQNSDLVNAKNQAEQAKEHAEFLAAAKQQFLANMSHEIRTPMNGVKGMAELLEQAELNGTERKYLEIIKASADNLIVIINDILDYTKIESGNLVLEETVIHLPRILDTIVAGHREQAEKKGLRVSVEIAPEVPETFLGDSVRLSQVLINLFSNAVKFTIEGSIVVKCLMLEETEDDLLLRFSVRDTGIGIPRDKFGVIFDVFTQASNNTTRKFGGTGLGLSISKQLVELQGGNMYLDSELGKGSVFSFELRFKKNKELQITKPKEEKEELALAPPAANGKSEGKVLLAEDNEVNQLLVQTLLSQWGYEVEVAENGSRALELLKQKPYNLILMDVHMPELDGYETTRAIRQDLKPPKSNIPIIAMTASALKGEAERCLEVGMDDYISKPFDRNLLYEKLARYSK